jgi:hypothetical protein
MADFPPLKPSARTYSPGAFPHTAHPAYRGTETRVRHSNTVLGVRLRLFFPALTTEELLLVRDHYLGQRGRFEAFEIPVEVLSGTDLPAAITPTGHRWRYASKPSVVDIPVDGALRSVLHDLSIDLETVPPEASIAGGVLLRVRISLEGGSAQRGAAFMVRTSIAGGGASGSRTIPALALVVVVALDGGRAADAPLALSVGVALTGGRATPSDLALSAVVTLSGGEATGD